MTEAKMRAHDVLDTKIEKKDFTMEYINGLHMSPLDCIGGSAKWISENFDEMCKSEDNMKVFYEILGKGLVRFLLNEKEFLDLVKEVKENDKC